MIIYEPSRTFNEFLLLPNLTGEKCVAANVSLRTPLVKFAVGQEPKLSLNIPFVSAAMQSVSGSEMAISLARVGGLSFIFCSQPVAAQAEMVSKVKKYKAGFVVSDTNVSINNCLKDVLAAIEKTSHSTVAVTDNGKSDGKLLGLICDKDFRVSRDPLDKPVPSFMVPFEKLIYGTEGMSISEANDKIWDSKISCLPIVDKNQNLKYLVFRKDYDDHKENPESLHDDKKRFMTGAAVNTKDYEERIPALVEAGADILCLDSSDGYSQWQRNVIEFVRRNYGEDVKIGAGNIVDKEAFEFLAESGADFIKVGIGGGSICTTREQKGIGRGQATALIEVTKARDEYLKKNKIYIPICSDGGIVHDNHSMIALAMGADFVMLGRYFARFDESPSKKVLVNNSFYKEYWGEGSNKAKNWQRYDLGGDSRLGFEEGVDSYVPYAGKLKDNIDQTVYKIKSTMCNCGSLTLEELHKKARLTLVSSTSIQEGGAHDVLLKNHELY